MSLVDESAAKPNFPNGRSNIDRIEWKALKETNKCISTGLQPSSEDSNIQGFGVSIQAVYLPK